MLGNLQITLAAIAALVCATASAEEAGHATVAGDLKIVHAWTRATDAGGDALVFMEIDNAGTADRLTGGRSDIASGVTIVGLTIAGDEISTAPVGPIDVPRGEIELDPGGLALALSDLRDPLAVGSELEMTLTFERAGDVVIHIEVEPVGAKQHSHAGHEH